MRSIARSAGFTYVWLLVAVAVMAAGLAAIGEVASTTAKREKEAELLFVGDQFARAIAEYHASSPGPPQYPRKLEELLADNRYPNARRYLRRVYPDPMTGRADWGLVRGPGGGIVGVHSQSMDRPLKIANFPQGYESFAGSAAYSSWVFGFAPPGGGGAQKAATKPPVQGIPIVPTAPGVIAAPPTAGAPPPSPRERRVGLVPRDPSLCAAARANDLRDCDRTGGAASDECTQRAAQRYRACLAGGTVE